VPGPVTAIAADPGRLLATACGIADQIVARSVGDDDRANWLGLEFVDDRQWMLLPMGAGLATGYCGVALFLAQLARVTGIARYADLARRAVRPVPLVCEAVAGHPELLRAVGCGGFAGFGGIAYALARIGTLLDDAPAREWAAAAVDVAATAAEHEEPAGVVAGTAGCLAAMTAIHAELGSAAAGRLARDCADRLVALVDRTRDGSMTTADPAPGTGPPVAGFAHGSTGVGWALARYAAAGGDRYAQAAAVALAGSAPLAGPGWCVGAAGEAMARAQAGATDHDAVVAVLAAQPPRADLSLCHGELGVCDALTVLATGHDSAGAARERRRRAALVVGAIERYGPRGGVPRGVASPGLLNGLAGIGYGLLRLGYADNVPSVLLLEPSPAKIDKP
jgi:lantibiotic modifying enzyme